MPDLLSSSTISTRAESNMAQVHFDGVDVINNVRQSSVNADHPSLNSSNHTGLYGSEPDRHDSAPPAPPEQHRRTSLQPHHPDISPLRPQLSHDDSRAARSTFAFGGVSKRAAKREIRQSRKKEIMNRRGWQGGYDPYSGRFTISTCGGSAGGGDVESSAPTEGSPLMDRKTGVSSLTIPEEAGDEPIEALKEMFLENKINVLFVFIPLAVWSHASKWSDGSVFILNFLAMVPLASMLGVFTEELAAHTNDVIGGLINATFGNAVELVVAIQALLANDFRVVQASLIGSVFSNVLLVLGMCFFCGGIKYSEQEFIAQGAVASIAMLAFSGLTLLMPEFFGDSGEDGDTELLISRMGAILLILLYFQMLFFQLKTHVHLFEGDDDVVALIPFSWALIGLVVITAIVTILSEFLVGSIDGFCEEFNLGRSFVGVIILPVVGNAVEHISAVSVAMKNKIDLALGVALGSAVQIALFVLPSVVVLGWFTGKEMSMKFPSFEVYLYLLAVILVSLCLSNQRSNWLEGSLLVFTYIAIAIGLYFEKDVIVD